MADVTQQERKGLTNTVLLEAEIAKSGYKKGYLAACCNLTLAGFSNCVNNKAEFKASQIDMLCELLRIDLDRKELIFFDRSGV